MGSNLVSSLDDDFIIKKYKQMDLLTVSPSTTGCVLTSVATATYPNQHGIIGWYSHNREFKIDYCPLLFNNRNNEKSLSEYNIKPSDIYKTKSKFNELNITTKVLYPDYICNSVYSNFVASNDKRISYQNYEEIVKIVKEITNNKQDTFTYLYLPEIDNLEHDNGLDAKIIKQELKKIDNVIKDLLTIKDLTIIVTADHGQINIEQDIVMDFKKYNDYFYGMPGIDFATTTFYVKKDKKEIFGQEFKKDFKNKMFLFQTEEFYQNHVFGLGNPSDYLKDNLGEYIGICKNHYCFINDEQTYEYKGKTLGNHSGFSKEEMIIPLVIINSNKY